MQLDVALGPPQVQRWHKASKLKKFKDIDLPKFKVWNYDACEMHETPQADCSYRKCGGEPFRHQKISAMYNFFARKSIVASSTGVGKTNGALLALAVMDHIGEKVRCVAVVPTSSVLQWTAEIQRWTPGFKVANIPSGTPKAKRISTYASQWNILVIGYHVYAKDYEHLLKVGAEQVIVDDVDPALNTANATHKALKALCSQTPYVIFMNATPLHADLIQLFAASVLIGGQVVWGTKTNFVNTYTKREKVAVYTKRGRKNVFKTTGFKAVSDFRSKFKPMNIRFTYEDIAGDSAIPDLMTEQVYLDMSPKQLRRYHELQAGVRSILNSKEKLAATKSINAMTAFMFGAQVCSGLFCLKTSDEGYEKDGPEASPKLDWIMSKLEGEWVKEKIVVYARFRGAITALQNRLKTAGIGYSTIWGVETDSDARNAEVTRFWEDPNDRVMIISVSGERSLNLQNARILVMWDVPTMPARAIQIAGRIRRAGSKNSKVYIFQLLHNDSQEERYMLALSARQALADYVNETDTSNLREDQMLVEKLSPEQLLRLISP